MNMNSWSSIFPRLKSWWEAPDKWRVLIGKLYGPVHTIGDLNRVRKPDEKDADEARLVDFNRSWLLMFREDTGRKRLMTHVSLLVNISGLLFLIFFFSGLYLPAKHWIFSAVLLANAATIPYWLWVGGWYNRIQKRVFEAFKKKFGKNFHLK